MKKLIKSVHFPETDNYYESSSADGFALLGAARVIVGLSYKHCLNRVIVNNYSLNANKLSGPNQILVSEENQYIYTLWTCSELLYRINQPLKEITKRAVAIGEYPGGHVRYCSEEIDFLVPNVLSAAGLIYSYAHKHIPRTKKYVNMLRQLQEDDGNWSYRIQSTSEKYKKEDAHHLAMMIYQLGRINEISGIKTEDIIEKALNCLENMDTNIMTRGRIGWAVPSIYLASMYGSEKLKETFRDKVLDSINDDNFRVRAFAAFALAVNK